MNYWTCLYDGVSWTEFLNAGGTVTGFREGRWSVVKRIQVGDRLLCYATGVSRWIGILEVVGPPAFERDRGARIWSREYYPARVPVRVLTALEPDSAVPMQTLEGQLSYFPNGAVGGQWSWHLRKSPRLEAPEDAAVVVEAIEVALRNPVVRPIEERRWKARRL